MAEGANFDMPPDCFGRVVWVLAPGGSGERAGLRVGDRILRVNGMQPASVNEALRGPEGTVVALQVQRSGEPPFELSVVRAPVSGVFRPLSATAVYETADGALWLGLYQGEILRRDAASGWRLYTAADGLDIGLGTHLLQTRDGVLWTASPFEGGLNSFDGTEWTSLRLSDIGGKDSNSAMVEADGVLWVSGHHGVLHALRDGAWTVYRPSQIPLPSTRTVALLAAADSALWVAGQHREVVRLDYGVAEWLTYKGLIFEGETSDGAKWFLTHDNSVVRHHGQEWVRYDQEDGLMEAPSVLMITSGGEVWCGGRQGFAAATAHFNGTRWDLNTHPQLSWGIDPRVMYETADGDLWFGAMGNFSAEMGQLGGLLRFGGGKWRHYLPPEAPVAPYGIGQTTDGRLWFGGHRLRYLEGEVWKDVTEPRSLSVPFVDAVHIGRTGDLWVGTRNYGAFYHAGGEWTNYGEADGLANDRVQDIIETADGSVWAATPAGISRFDGSSWLDRALSLEAPGQDWTLLRASHGGALWINRGDANWFGRGLPGLPGLLEFDGVLRATRYQAPTAEAPTTLITTSLDRVSQPGNTTLVWEGVDRWQATPNEELQYAWRLDDGDWSLFSTANSHLFFGLPSGQHTFAVKARDHHFNEDPTPATVRFTVTPPIWQEPWFVGLMGLLLGIIVVQTRRVVRTNKQRRLEMEEELQTAHDMQMRLMPQESPRLTGFDIAGCCLPATRVGGDLFQYFHLPGGRLAFAVADVTGKAMEAAIPMVMFSGILESQMEADDPLDELCAKLNRSLNRTLDARTFVCFTIGSLDQSSRTLHLTNCGCPYPYHYVAEHDEIVELQIDSYPLGVVADASFSTIELCLGAGDRLVFCSDGIAEAGAVGRVFGDERTAAAVLQGCRQGLSAGELVNGIVAAVTEFAGDAPQQDDITCVVLEVQS